MLIPPSIPMIVYGFLTEESVVDLFLAGIGPGLLLTALFVSYAVVHARLGGIAAPSPRASWAERRRRTWAALPTLALAVAVVAGIYAGVFTPTEAAAVGFVLALVVVLGIHRSLRLRDLPGVARDSMRTAAMVLFIIAGAKVFGHAIALYQVPQEVTRAAVAAAAAPEGFVAAVCALLLIMGCVLETLSMMLLMLPIIDPVARRPRHRPNLVRSHLHADDRMRLDHPADGPQPVRHPRRRRPGAAGGRCGGDPWRGGAAAPRPSSR